MARLLSRKGHRICVWEFDPHAAKILDEERQLKFKLPGVLIDASVGITSHLNEALAGASGIILAVPAHVMRPTCRALSKEAPQVGFFLSVAKGLEKGTQKRMSEVVREELGEERASRFAVLSGPSHAEEVGRDVPTTVVAAAAQPAVAGGVERGVMSPSMGVDK